MQQALAGGVISLPREVLAAQGEAKSASKAAPEQTAEIAGAAPEQQAKNKPVEVVNPTIIPVGSEDDDAAVFRVTVRQQIEIIHAALETLKKDGTHKDSIDAVYRCLIAIKNACNFVGQNDIKIYAERTAGIVEQGRKTDLVSVCGGPVAAGSGHY